MSDLSLAARRRSGTPYLLGVLRIIAAFPVRSSAEAVAAIGPRL